MESALPIGDQEVLGDSQVGHGVWLYAKARPLPDPPYLFVRRVVVDRAAASEVHAGLDVLHVPASRVRTEESPAKIVRTTLRGHHVYVDEGRGVEGDPEDQARFDFSDVIREINSHLSDKEFAQVREKLIKKDQARRFEISMAILAQLLDEGPALVQGDQEERLLEWRRCVAWVEDLWTSAADSWRSGHFAVAAGLSITTIEESGKLAVERFRLLGADSIDITSDAGIRVMAQWKPRAQAFRDHFTKHVMAATAGASVNARIDRLLGMDFIIAFLESAEQQQLEAFRQRCLYLDRTDDLHVPSEVIAPDHAAKYVTLAGEILAELVPMPDEWTRVLDRVRVFERTAGLPYE